MFRAAVVTALQMAQDGTSGLISGCTPAQFVCGMSADLGVPLRCEVTPAIGREHAPP